MRPNLFVGIFVYLHFPARFWSGSCFAQAPAPDFEEMLPWRELRGTPNPESVSRCLAVLSAAKYDEIGSLTLL